MASRVRQSLALVLGIAATVGAPGCGGAATPSSSTTATEVHPAESQGARTKTGKPKRPAKPRIAVPDVVGQDERAARAELAAHRLQARFVSHNIGALVCAQQSPGSTTTSQFPRAGDRIRAGASVHLTTNAYVQTGRDGCGRASASRACAPRELSLHVTNGFPEYTGGSEVQLAGVRVERVGNGSACNVESTMSFEVDQGGQLVSGVAGNPMSLQFDAALDPGESMFAGWTIGGWCGSTKGVTAVATLEGLTAQGSLTHLTSGTGSCPPLRMYSLYKKRGY